jgi:hypothetical protein
VLSSSYAFAGQDPRAAAGIRRENTHDSRQSPVAA